MFYETHPLSSRVVAFVPFVFRLSRTSISVPLCSTLLPTAPSTDIWHRVPGLISPSILVVHVRKANICNVSNPIAGGSQSATDKRSPTHAHSKIRSLVPDTLHLSPAFTRTHDSNVPITQSTSPFVYISSSILLKFPRYRARSSL